MLRRIENIFVIIIIVCSTSLYKISFIGPISNLAEIVGILLIFALLLIHIVYSDKPLFKHHFTVFLMLIFIAMLTSMFMAKFSRGQNFSDTFFAQRSLYYYLFYFLLHQLKIKPEDLEKIFLGFGFVYVILYLIQFFLYPIEIFDVFMLKNRGTVRIYLTGSDYLFISYLMSIQAFLRANKLKYLIFIFIFFSISILLGGRETMAIMIFILILFILFSRKVKSRLFIGMLMIIGVFAILILFQDVFQALLKQTKSDASLGDNYIRVVAAKYFLTDFFKTPWAYLTGNGMYAENSAYGIEIARITSRQFFLGDIGLVGNFAIYGSLFIIGVLGICFKAVAFPLKDRFIYIRYLFIAGIMVLITGGGFAKSDYICFIVCILYMIDASPYLKENQISEVFNY